VSSVSEDEIIAAITGQARLGDLGGPTGPGASSGERVLELGGLAAVGIGPIDCGLRPGEVLGIFGLLGSGRSELLETIVGARPRLAGVLRLDGSEVSFKRPAAAIAAGIAYVPAERRKQALFMAMSSLDNLLMPSLGGLASRGLRRRRAEREAFARLGGSLQLVPLRPGLEVERLSGGNQQKVSVGRWLAPDRELRALLLDEPTQGVDVGARRQLYDVLRRLAAEKDVGVMLTSSDPEELEAVADRVVVLSRGRAVGELSGSAIREAELVRLAHTRDEAA
jgi:ribose transport system ATP-binding protein